MRFPFGRRARGGQVFGGGQPPRGSVAGLVSPGERIYRDRDGIVWHEVDGEERTRVTWADMFGVYPEDDE